MITCGLRWSPRGKMLLVVIDAHSKWIEAIPLKTAIALTTIRQLRKLFAQLGIQNTLVSDNGPQFAISMESAIPE